MTDKPSVTKDKRWWLISVSGYGSWAFWGTKVEAQDRARDKAEWEGGRGLVHKDVPQSEIDWAIKYHYGGKDPSK